MPSLLALLVLSALSPDQIAAIEREQAKAQADIAERHGNKKSSELSADERRSIIAEQAEAEQRVLDKFGLSKKDWALAQARQTRDEREQVKVARAAQDAKAKAEEAAKQKPAEAGPVQVQRGFSDENPVVLEEKAGGPVVVEKGLPAEAKADQEAASEADRLEGITPKGDKPEGGGGKHGGRGKRDK